MFSMDWDAVVLPVILIVLYFLAIFSIWDYEDIDLISFIFPLLLVLRVIICLSFKNYHRIRCG